MMIVSGNTTAVAIHFSSNIVLLS